MRTALISSMIFRFPLKDVTIDVTGCMETKWAISKEVLSSKIDDEVVLMSMEADAYFGLDPIGSHVWELLSERPSTVSELVQTLTKEYDIDAATCLRDVEAFIRDMSERKLILKSA